MLVLPVSVALRSPHTPTLKPHPSHCHNNTFSEKKHYSTVTDTKTTMYRCASENDRVFPIATPQCHVSAIYSTQHSIHTVPATIRGLQCLSACVYVLCISVTPEYAAEASGEDSRLPVMCSVPHRRASSGHYSAGNSTPAFWQTLAPPKIK